MEHHKIKISHERFYDNKYILDLIREANQLGTNGRVITEIEVEESYRDSSKVIHFRTVKKPLQGIIKWFKDLKVTF